MDNKSYFLDQLNKIINEYNLLKQTSNSKSFADKTDDVGKIMTKAKATIERAVGIKSEYYKEIIRISEIKGFEGLKLKPIMGSIFALKDDLENDYLKNYGEIIRSEVFSDFLEMAEYLLKQGYKDPSAVLIGSVLEEHLRQLCLKYGIPVEITKNGKPVPKKADSLNSELASVGSYNKLDQKSVTSWLDLRNKAAHGKYDEYSKEQVELMHQGVMDFMVRTNS